MDLVRGLAASPRGREAGLLCASVVALSACVKFSARRLVTDTAPAEQAPATTRGALKALLRETGWPAGWACVLPLATAAHFAVQARTYRLLGRMGAALAEKSQPRLSAACAEYLLLALPLSLFSALGPLAERRLEWALRERLQGLVLARLPSSRFYPQRDLAAVTTDTDSLAGSITAAARALTQGSVKAAGNFGYLAVMLGGGVLARILGLTIASACVVKAFTPPFKQLRLQVQRAEADALARWHRCAEYREEVDAWRGGQEEVAALRLRLGRIQRARKGLDFVEAGWDVLSTFATKQVGIVWSVLGMMPLASRSRAPLEDLTLAIHLLVGSITGTVDAFRSLKPLQESEALAAKVARFLKELEPRPAPEVDTPGLRDEPCARLDGVRCAGVEGLSWSIHSGERWLVRGPSGVGKTSLLRILAGVTVPEAGRLARQPLVVYMPQRSYAEGASLLAAVVYPAERPGDARLAQELLELVDLDPALDVQGLSAGELQRVCIARALYAVSRCEPCLVLFDEPTAHVAEAFQDRFFGLLAEGAAPRAASPGVRKALALLQRAAVVVVAHHARPAGFRELVLDGGRGLVK